MDTANKIIPESWSDSVQPARAFFSNSILRSGKFLAASTLLGLSIAMNFFVLIRFWNKVQPWMVFLLTLFGLGGVLIPWLWAISCHKRVRASVPKEDPEEQSKKSPLDSALVAAATMTLDTLFVYFATILMLSGIIAYLLAGGPLLTH